MAKMKTPKTQAQETEKLAGWLDEMGANGTDGEDALNARYVAAAARLRDLLGMVEDLAPPLPINQDVGGCVWCGGTPPGQNGYAKATPEHHDANCPWLVARQFIGLEKTP